ncbi:hypothetical protein [Methylovirgula sp. 4M-Z18]|uniref:hypothetical protein n=1 Tax=Methylovirgula sp. 4M-Z18 TaxID=2293567 RepID=UPI000E2EE402|nr:hypothetical protein [Methylovirgula sp. 4M-Z18]RFB80903.1 hypothetical protein DYH55_05355 [Methylovirgula sp. 4M-Z18]
MSGLLAKLPQFGAEVVRSPGTALKRAIRSLVARARNQALIRQATNKLYDALPQSVQDKIRRLILRPIEQRATLILTVDDLTARGRSIYAELRQKPSGS